MSGKLYEPGVEVDMVETTCNGCGGTNTYEPMYLLRGADALMDWLSKNVPQCKCGGATYDIKARLKGQVAQA